MHKPRIGQIRNGVADLSENASLKETLIFTTEAPNI
jgi:hypothetical protein